MRPLTRPGLVLAIAVAVVALPTAASGALSATAAPTLATTNSTSYQDSSGEDPAAPDITTLVVSNTDASLISFKINIPNRPQLTQDMLMVLWVDSDNNAQTGDVESSLGADYLILLFQGDIALLRWDGSQFNGRAGDPPATSLRFAYQAGVTITISAAELGNTKRFGFAARATSGIVVDPVTGALDFANSVSDDAPAASAGFFNYEVKITPPSLVVKKLTPSPARPTAGKAFTLRLVAARSDTGAVVQNGKVTCVGRVGKARLKAQIQRVVGGAATCTWNLPPTAKAKTFRGSVAVVFEGLKASQGFAGKVR